MGNKDKIVCSSRVTPRLGHHEALSALRRQRVAYHCPWPRYYRSLDLVRRQDDEEGVVEQHTRAVVVAPPDGASTTAAPVGTDVTGGSLSPHDSYTIKDLLTEVHHSQPTTFRHHAYHEVLMRAILSSSSNHAKIGKGGRRGPETVPTTSSSWWRSLLVPFLCVHYPEVLHRVFVEDRRGAAWLAKTIVQCEVARSQLVRSLDRLTPLLHTVLTQSTPQHSGITRCLLSAALREHSEPRVELVMPLILNYYTYHASLPASLFTNCMSRLQGLTWLQSTQLFLINYCSREGDVAGVDSGALYGYLHKVYNDAPLSVLEAILNYLWLQHRRSIYPRHSTQALLLLRLAQRLGRRGRGVPSVVAGLALHAFCVVRSSMPMGNAADVLFQSAGEEFLPDNALTCVMEATTTSTWRGRWTDAMTAYEVCMTHYRSEWRSRRNRELRAAVAARFLLLERRSSAVHHALRVADFAHSVLLAAAVLVGKWDVALEAFQHIPDGTCLPRDARRVLQSTKRWWDGEHDAAKGLKASSSPLLSQWQAHLLVLSRMRSFLPPEQFLMVCRNDDNELIAPPDETPEKVLPTIAAELVTCDEDEDHYCTAHIQRRYLEFISHAVARSMVPKPLHCPSDRSAVLVAVEHRDDGEIDPL